MKAARGPATALLMVAAAWLRPCAVWADKPPAPAATGKGQGTPYPLGPPPPDYLQRSSWLWEFEGGTSQGHETVFFTITRAPLSEPSGPYNFWPTILVSSSGVGRVVDLREHFPRYIWSHAAAAPGRGYFWGFLEHAVEDAGTEWPLIMSRDGGRTWSHVATLQKPDREATFLSFEMSEKGRGQVQWMSRKGAPPGMRKLFTAVTTDWGRTWRRELIVALSVLEEGRVPAGNHPCWVAVRNLPEPLPEACRFPPSILNLLGSPPDAKPANDAGP